MQEGFPKSGGGEKADVEGLRIITLLSQREEPVGVRQRIDNVVIIIWRDRGDKSILRIHVSLTPKGGYGIIMS